MTEAELSYPVICLARDGSIISYFGAESIGRCNAFGYWKNRYFDDLIVIDNQARTWKVVEATLVDEPGAAGRFFKRVLNRPLRVRLELRAIDDETGIMRAKRHLVEWLDRLPEFWEASAGLDAWRTQISRCRTIEELALLFD